VTTHLVIPDGHAHPDHNNDRFEWIGKLIADLRPEVVVNVGDMADMPSLSSYDKGSKGFEGRRYKKDVESMLDAQDRLFTPTKKIKYKKARYVYTIGNHEERINRAVNAEAILDGTIGMSDLQLEDYGWETYPFMDIVVVDDIAYSHYFASGVMGRPIGGENPAKSLLNKQHMSVTAGHTHTLDLATTINAAGKRIIGLVCGAYVDYTSGWNNVQSEALWWSGVVIKRNVEGGSYDPQFISIESLRKEYASHGKTKRPSRAKRFETTTR
jgi:hypothetical protein